MRNMWMMMAMVCAASVNGAAQSGSPQDMHKVDDSPITVTGCVQNGPAKSATEAMGGGYLLSNAVMGKPAPSMATGTERTGSAGVSPTGTSGTATAALPTSSAPSDAMPMAHPAMSYKLDGRDSELKNHVGHKVEITGMLDGRHGVTANATPMPAASTETAQGGMDTTVPQALHVTSVKMISPDCSAK